VNPTHEDHFTGVAGRSIMWRSWLAGSEPRAMIVLAHGFGEHSGRYFHVAARLQSEGYAVHALDHHGHGRSEGARGRITLADAVTDLDQLIVLASNPHPGLPVFLLGHSMGGAIALRYCMVHQDRLTGLILSAPLAEVEGRAVVQTIGKLLGAIAPGLGLVKIDPKLVSRDPAVVKAYAEDPLVFHKPIPAGTVAEFIRHVESLPNDVPQITLPTLLMYGTADKLAAPSGSVMVSQRIGSKQIQTTPYEGLYHEILNEPEQNAVLDEIAGWLARQLEAAAGEVVAGG
jgi:acylglycerol lipase